MNKGLFKFFDVAYFMKFALYVTTLYYFHLFYIGITAPGGLYSPFLAHYLNYVHWVSQAVLYTAKIITHAFGLRPYVDDMHNLTVVGEASVGLRYSCIGLGIMSFWAAFVCAHKSGWRHKLYWCLGGTITIWFLNCWRVALVLVALQRHWPVNKYIDHHDMFNLAAYSLIGLMMYFYSKKNNRNNTTAVAPAYNTKVVPYA